MKYLILLIFSAISLSGLVRVPAASQDMKESKCHSISNSRHGLSGSLVELLGPPTSCARVKFEHTDVGNYETYQLSWQGVYLTIENQPPETGIYVLEIDKTETLPNHWFGMMQDALTQAGWKNMNWSFDEFPGPSAEHYSSSLEGQNAQAWLERDGSGNITWFRFSYVL